MAVADAAEDMPEHLKPARPYTMDLTIVVSKKRINKLATVRNTIRKRMRACIRLAVQHGVFCEGGKRAQVGAPQKGKASAAREEEEDVRLFMDEREAGTHKWLLPGHIYVMHPTLEVFQLPLPLLHQRVCQGLKAVRTLGLQIQLEAKALDELRRTESFLREKDASRKNTETEREGR